MGIILFLAVYLLSTAKGSTDQNCHPTFNPWRSNNKDCWNPCDKTEKYCPEFCGIGGYCCKKGKGGPTGVGGGCPEGADEASPKFHSCVNVKSDITEEQWTKMKEEYKRCTQTLKCPKCPKCDGCMITIMKYLPILMQAGKLGEGEVGENNVTSYEKKPTSKGYMDDWVNALNLMDGVTKYTDNEILTVDGKVNGIVGGMRNYDNYQMRHRPTGLYAAKGKIVTINVPKEMVGKLGIIIGITEFKEFKIDFPPIEDPVLKVASPWGGPIILHIAGNDAINGPFKVKVTNALRAPTYVLGKNTNDEWNNELKHYSPNWAVLRIPKQVNIFVNSFRIKYITDMEAAMSRIKKTVDLLEELMDLPPNSKPGADIWIFNAGESGGGWRGGVCRPGSSTMGYSYVKEFFDNGAEGVTLHEAGHGWCYGGLPSNGGQWTAETVRSYIEYKLGIFDHPIKKGLMDSPDLDFNLLYRMVSFGLYSNGKACGDAKFNSKQLSTGAYDVCWKWLSWIPEKAHGWDVYKKVNALVANSKTNYKSNSDRMIDLYCQATKHNMLPLFTGLYNLQPADNIKENCEKLPKSELIGKWLDIVECVKESMTTEGKDIRKCAALPHFPKHEGLCVLSGECENDEANGGKTTTMTNKFDIYGSTGPWLSKKFSAVKEINCYRRAIDFFKDCKNKDDNKITATFYGKETNSYTHPPLVLVPWTQISDADCYYECGKKGGLCPSFCGLGGYCCRDGYDGCPLESIGASPSKHTCVTNKKDSWIQKDGKDCWYECGKKGGSCPDFCGSNGFCCRKGYSDCPLLAADKSPKHHTCVLKKETGKK